MEPENKFLEHLGLRTALIWAIIVFVGLPTWVILAHSGFVNGSGIGLEIVFNLICLVLIRYITRLILWGAAYILEDFPKTSKIVYRLLFCASLIFQITLILWGIYVVLQGFEILAY